MPTPSPLPPVSSTQDVPSPFQQLSSALVDDVEMLQLPCPGAGIILKLLEFPFWIKRQLPSEEPFDKVACFGDSPSYVLFLSHLPPTPK